MSEQHFEQVRSGKLLRLLEMLKFQPTCTEFTRNDLCLSHLRFQRSATRANSVTYKWRGDLAREPAVYLLSAVPGSPVSKTALFLLFARYIKIMMFVNIKIYLRLILHPVCFL